MICSRHFARASAWTFTIHPIRDLISRYSAGSNWADPFSGRTSPAQYTNDLNPDLPTMYHLDAVDFADVVPYGLDGVLFDPPYSYRQISEHYKEFGRTASSKDTSYNFYGRVMSKLAPKIKDGGYAMSFGWNSNGFPKKLGFHIVEVMIVAHGLHHNDTIVTVQKKVEENK